MKASEYVKAKGFRTLKDVADILGINRVTFSKRFNNNKKLFEESVDSALKIREGRLKND